LLKGTGAAPTARTVMGAKPGSVAVTEALSAPSDMVPKRSSIIRGRTSSRRPAQSEPLLEARK
jgi:hypothetical protein